MQKNMKYFSFCKFFKTILLIPILFYQFSSIIAYSYELNKNIIYYHDNIRGYLLADEGKWAIICEEDNTSRCLLSQFIQPENQNYQFSLLLNILKIGQEYTIRIIVNDNSNKEMGSNELRILTNTPELSFKIEKIECQESKCEYVMKVPDELMEKLNEETEILIAIKSIDRSIMEENTIGLLVDTLGFKKSFELIK
tara:strand:- start:1818 stop:2405 length:588 start_codon:yes stop_codon:yes gene_type:complete